MRVLITGCAGFIGSHLAERLVGDGWHVTGIDALTSYYDPAEKRANLAVLGNEPRFDFVRADIVSAPLTKLLADRPLVVHFAAQPGVRRSFGDGFDQYVHDNILATQRLLEAAAEADCPRVVYASSSSVYGEAATFPCREESTPTRPRSPYGVTKRTCEKLAEIYRGLGLSTVGLRFFTVYGPRQRPDMAIRRLCETAAGGPAFRLNGDGSQSRDFTYVDDAVRAFLLAATRDEAVGEVFNLGDADPVDLVGLAELLIEVNGGGSFRLVPFPPERRAIDIGDYFGDFAKIRERLGWTPEVPLREGLARSLEFYREHGARYWEAAA